MNFKKWLQLQEVGTGSSAVAVFARPVGGMHTRTFVEPITFTRKKKKRKRKKKKKNK